MEKWFREHFLVFDEDGQELMQWQNAEGKATRAPLAYVVSMFAAVESPPTATALKAVDPDDTMGWHQHFDEWVKQGIIQP